MPKKKIGLALSSGATRGIFLPGIMRVLKREGIKIDFVAGSSVGAIGAIGVGLDLDPEFMIEWGEKTKFWQYITPELHDDLGVINFDHVIRRGMDVTGDIDFSDFKIKTAFVALDLETSEPVVFNEGKVWEALRGAVGAPSIFAPLRKNGHYYVDSGLTNPLPVDVVRQMGADIVIAVDQGPIAAENMQFDHSYFHLPVFTTINRAHAAYKMFMHYGGTLHRNAIDREIKEQKPEIVLSLKDGLAKKHISKDIGFFEMGQAKLLIKIGEEEATKAIPKIKELVNYEESL